MLNLEVRVIVTAAQVAEATLRYLSLSSVPIFFCWCSKNNEIVGVTMSRLVVSFHYIELRCVVIPFVLHQEREKMQLEV